MATTRGVYLYDDEDAAIKDLANREHRTISYVLGDLLRKSTDFRRVVYNYRQTVLKPAEPEKKGETSE